MRFLITGLLILTSSITLASSPQHFDKLFKINRDQSGEIKTITIKMAPKKFSLKPFINSVVEKIKFEKNRANANQLSFVADEEYSNLTSSLEPPRDSEIRYGRRIKESLKRVRKIDLAKLKSKLASSKILQNFQSKVNKQFLMLHPGIAANLEDTRFFFKKKTITKVAQETLKIIKDRVNDVPLLNTLAFLVNRIPAYFMGVREFHQNMLIYYLENYSEDELGITKEEADKIMSSVYESRVGALRLDESNSITKNWLNYGYDQFYTQVRVANNAMRFSKYRNNLADDRVNFAFHRATLNGEPRIINLFAKKHMFSKEFAVAFYPEKPRKVFRTRFYMFLAQIGLSFVPKIPAIVKTMVNTFLDSVYTGQGSTEGSLYIHYLETGNIEMAKRIKLQNMNPYLGLL